MTADRAAPRPTRRPTNGSSRREELLRIAAHVFATRGIASATVRDIAEEAGILSGSLYHHFTSKEEMVKEIITPGPTANVERQRELIAAAAGEWAEALRMCVLDAVRRVAHDPDVARIFRNDAKYISETPALADSEQRRQAHRRLWVDLVAAGVADGTFRSDLDVDVVVRAMFDAILASIRWFPPLGKSKPDEVGEELAKFFVAGILETPRPRTRTSSRPATESRRQAPRAQTA